MKSKSEGQLPAQGNSTLQRSAWLHAVFQQYEAKLVGYASRLVGDPDRGRDIVQDVFLRLCREAPDDRERIASWLYTVCRNRAIDIARKEKRMRTTTEPIDVESSSADPATTAEQHDDTRHVAEILDQLPENQREVIRLKIEHGLKYREIAEVTGLTTTNVGYLLHQGLKSLRLKMNATVD